MKGLIKMLLREGLEGWKPVMTEDEGLSWNTSSKYGGFVYHKTWKQNAESIMVNGFEYGKASHSRGMYDKQKVFHFSSEPTNANIGYGDTLLKCVINVSNPVPPNVFNELQNTLFSKYRKLFADSLGKGNWDDLTSGEQSKFFQTKFFGELNNERSEYLKSNYDSMIHHPKDMWVFDPKNIVVIK